MSASYETTALLAKWAGGDRRALDDLTSRLYAQLTQLAASYLKDERPDDTLEPSELVDEVYVRLLDQEKAPFCQSCSHFFAIAARLMREILVDHARRRHAGKRAGHRVSLTAAMTVPDDRSADLLTLADGLKALEELDARKCQAIELRYFAGFSTKEIAQVLNVSAKTAQRDLAFGEAWLCHEMQGKRTLECRTLGTGRPPQRCA